MAAKINSKKDWRIVTAIILFILAAIIAAVSSTDRLKQSNSPAILLDTTEPQAADDAPQESTTNQGSDIEESYE